MNKILTYSGSAVIVLLVVGALFSFGSETNTEQLNQGQALIKEAVEIKDDEVVVEIEKNVEEKPAPTIPVQEEEPQVQEVQELPQESEIIIENNPEPTEAQSSEEIVEEVEEEQDQNEESEESEEESEQAQAPEPPPPPSETPPEPEPEPQEEQQAQCININTASIEELQEIIHIGPSRANELVTLRPFSSVDDMDRITGIGPARIADIKAQGLACV